MARRKPQAPDTRPDWRDPDMPVLAGRTGQYVDHRKLQAFARQNLSANPVTHPKWDDDPTYDLRGRRARDR